MIDLFNTEPGTIIVVEQKEPWTFLGKKLRMIICFEGVSSVNTRNMYHTCRAIFMICWSGLFAVNCNFGINMDGSNTIRKPTPAEMFQLGDELRKHGYRYNRKTKHLTKINS